MFSIDPGSGLLLDCNDRYFEMTGHSKDKIYSMSFMETVHEESAEEAMKGWKLLAEEGIAWGAELVSFVLLLYTRS